MAFAAIENSGRHSATRVVIAPAKCLLDSIIIGSSGVVLLMDTIPAVAGSDFTTFSYLDMIRRRFGVTDCGGGMQTDHQHVEPDEQASLPSLGSDAIRRATEGHALCGASAEIGSVER